MLSVALQDTQHTNESATWSDQVNIPSLIGSPDAYVGFTASDGVSADEELVSSWTYQGFGVPTFTKNPAPSTSTPTGKSITLSALGADDDGESNLDYSWKVVKEPAGATTPTFSANNSNAAKNATMKFFKAGKYVVAMTMKNAGGITTTSEFPVSVSQTASAVRMTPHTGTVKRGHKLAIASAIVDQFGDTMTSTAPKFKLLSGHGSVNPKTGVFTASNTPGHAVVEAIYSKLLDGVVGITVTK